MKKKIKDLTLKEFYLFVTKQLEDIKPYCFTLNPIDALKNQNVQQYIKENGQIEVEVDE